MQSQNQTNSQNYQPESMRNKNPLSYYLQQFKITKNQLTNFTQTPNTVESLQTTMKPYLMGGSYIKPNKPLMIMTGTDPEYSVKEYLKAVTENLNLNIDPEPINTPFHQEWIHRSKALIQTTIFGAAQKWFPVLLIENKSDDLHKYF